MIKINKITGMNLIFSLIFMLLMSSCVSRQKPVPLKGELPAAPKYSGAPLKLEKGEVSPLFLVIPASDGKAQVAALKTLKKELSLLDVKQEKEIAALKAKIASLELIVIDFESVRNTTEQIKKNMKSAGYQISSGYTPGRNKTAEYLEKLKSKNIPLRDKNVNPEDYSLNNVLNDISDAAVEYDYNFKGADRAAIDRLVVVGLIERKEVYDTNNYGGDVKYQVEVYDSKSTRRIGAVEVCGRGIKELNSPLTEVKLNSERKNLKSLYEEATDQIPANLMKMKEFKKLLLEPSQDTTTKK